MWLCRENVERVFYHEFLSRVMFKDLRKRDWVKKRVLRKHQIYESERLWRGDRKIRKNNWPQDRFIGYGKKSGQSGLRLECKF